MYCARQLAHCDNLHSLLSRHPKTVWSRHTGDSVFLGDSCFSVFLLLVNVFYSSNAVHMGTGCDIRCDIRCVTRTQETDKSAPPPIQHLRMRSTIDWRACMCSFRTLFSAQSQSHNGGKYSHAQEPKAKLLLPLHDRYGSDC